MRRFAWALVAPMILLPLAACGDGGPSGLVVAKADNHELTVGETVRLLAPENNLPAQPEVVEAVADLWIDYTLLAKAAAADTTLENVDLEPLVRQQAEGQMITMLRDSMIHADTAVTDEDVRRAFSKEAPGSRVHARHILLAWPDQATDAQRDSVRALANDLLSRIKNGADFAQLAQRYSDDPGSASKGGDLGWFGRGEMVKPFEDAAFAMEPGETSDVVESPYGLHIIQVEEKETPSFDELGSRFRQQLVQERQLQAESTYVAGIEETAKPTVTDGAVDVVKTLAKNPTTRLSGRAGRRALVNYQGGSLTADEVKEFLQTRPPQFRSQVASASDEQIEQGILLALARRELLIQRAEAAGLDISPEDRDSVVTTARRAFKDAARQLGLLSIDASSGQSVDDAIEARVDTVLQAILRGQQDVIPLGAVSYTLRKESDVEINSAGVDRAVQQLKEVRGPATAPPAGGQGSGASGGGQQPPQPGGQAPAGPPPATATPDSAGGG